MMGSEVSQTRLKLVIDRFHMVIKIEECLSCHGVITVVAQGGKIVSHTF